MFSSAPKLCFIMILSFQLPYNKRMNSKKTQPAILIHDLTHRYKDTEVLKTVNLSVMPGEVFGFLGHNGAGKTTAVNIMTTLLKPSSGSVKIFGEDVVQNSFAVRRIIGYVPESVFLYDTLTARENLIFFAKLSGVVNAEQAVAKTLKFLDCEGLADRRLGTFSKGMRQRIGLAQAIVHQPKVLFLDEPTSGLDPEGVLLLRATILRLKTDYGMTIFMNTHLLSEVSKVCTNIGILRYGKLLYSGSLDDLTHKFPARALLEDIYLSYENQSK